MYGRLAGNHHADYQMVDRQYSMEGRLLTPQAINLLSQPKYENDFSELLAILRSAIMHTESNKVDVNGVRLILDQFSRNGLIARPAR